MRRPFLFAILFACASLPPHAYAQQADDDPVPGIRSTVTLVSGETLEAKVHFVEPMGTMQRPKLLFDGEPSILPAQVLCIENALGHFAVIQRVEQLNQVGATTNVQLLRRTRGGRLNLFAPVARLSSPPVERNRYFAVSGAPVRDINYANLKVALADDGRAMRVLRAGRRASIVGALALGTFILPPLYQAYQRDKANAEAFRTDPAVALRIKAPPYPQLVSPQLSLLSLGMFGSGLGLVLWGRRGNDRAIRSYNR
jgi:hypothetical protein